MTTLKTQAADRRNREHGRCGAALRAMRDRGEDLAAIATMAGIDQRAVRQLIKAAEQESDDGFTSASAKLYAAQMEGSR